MLISFFSGPISELAALALIMTSFIASVITVAMGLGGGILALGVMASVLPPAALIPLHGVVQVGANAGRAVVLQSYIYWKALPVFALGSLLGVALGGSIAISLPSHLVKLAVGVFVLWSVFGRPPKWLRKQHFATGVFSSFLTMFIGATGPFVAVFVRAITPDRMAFSATHAAMMTFQHSVKMIGFGILGFAFAPWAGLMIAMIVAGLLGTYLGKRILISRSEANYQKGLNVLLILIALHLIYAAITEGFL